MSLKFIKESIITPTLIMSKFVPKWSVGVVLIEASGIENHP